MIAAISMKPIVIKVIKRKALADIARLLPAKRSRNRPATVTATVNNWIAESRRNRIGNENAARARIAGWKTEPQT